MTCSEGKCTLVYAKPNYVLIKYNINDLRQAAHEVAIVNISRGRVTITTHLPMTKYFYLDAIPKNVLINAGYRIKMTIHLTNISEQRIYYDCFSVECVNGCIHEIQLEAVPLHKILEEIPRKINFGHVPLGNLATKIITFSPVAQKTRFLFIGISNNPDFAITPTTGVIHKEPVEVKIFYKPTAYITFEAIVQVYIPLIMNTPLCFIVSAYTKPGHLKDQIMKIANKLDKPESQNKNHILIRPNKKFHDIELVEKPEDPKLTQQLINKQFFKTDVNVKYDGETFLGPLGRYLEEEQEIKFLKQVEFNKEVEELRKENITTNTHHRTRLKHPVKIDKFDTNRLIEWDNYVGLLRPENNWSKLNGPILTKQRTVDYYNKREDLHFTDRHPNLWFVRYIKMIKFIEAARQIIIKNRLEKVLSKLKMLTKEDIEILENEDLLEEQSIYGEQSKMSSE